MTMRLAAALATPGFQRPSGASNDYDERHRHRPRRAAHRGERGDRASILAALEQVQPGGTIQFAPGTYLIGGEIIRIAVPRLTLLGHPEGTTLRGCGPDEMAREPGAVARDERCNLLELAGAGRP
jgi:hypothetical protein